MYARKYIAAAILFVSFTMFMLMNSCSNGSTAMVTIQLRSDHQAVIPSGMPWFDRVLGYFSTNAYAIAGWQSDYQGIDLVIMGSGMEKISASIPPNQTSFTIEVPAGNGREFNVYAVNSSIGKNYGGIATADLAPGEEVTLTIHMIPIPTNVTGFGVFCSTGTSVLTWDTPTIGGIQGYYIYRADAANGPYVRIIEITGGGTGSHNDLVPVFFEGKVYFYKISSFNLDGESAPTDPLSVILSNNC